MAEPTKPLNPSSSDARFGVAGVMSQTPTFGGVVRASVGLADTPDGFAKTFFATARVIPVM